MTVEVESKETEESEDVKTDVELADKMYKDNDKGEKTPDTESKEEESKEQSEEESKEKDGKEDGSEQEETGDGEDQSITLALSKDSLLKESAVAEVKEFAEKQGLDQEGAQAVLDQREADQSSFLETMKADHESSVEEWRVAAAEKYGDKLEETVAMANKPIKRFGKEGFGEWLSEGGFDTHPDVIDIFSAIGKAMSDDKFVDGSAPKTAKKSVANRMYPNDVK